MNQENNKNTQNNMSFLFDEKPNNWGLRGDPYFWEYLKEVFSNCSYKIKYKELKKIILDEHLKLTGIKLTRKSVGRCDKFAHGGMSSGLISGKFWIEDALPLLKQRIKIND